MWAIIWHDNSDQIKNYVSIKIKIIKIVDKQKNIWYNKKDVFTKGKTVTERSAKKALQRVRGWCERTASMRWKITPESARWKAEICSQPRPSPLVTGCIVSRSVSRCIRCAICFANVSGTAVFSVSWRMPWGVFCFEQHRVQYHGFIIQQRKNIRKDWK